jgi:hypothetical protein
MINSKAYKPKRLVRRQFFIPGMIRLVIFRTEMLKKQGKKQDAVVAEPMPGQGSFLVGYRLLGENRIHVSVVEDRCQNLMNLQYDEVILY